MQTNTRESGFEELFTQSLIQNGFVQKFYNDEHSGHYDRKECIDTIALFDFIERVQPKELEKLKVNYGADYKTKFLQRLQSKISTDGIIHVLRK